MEIQKKIGSIFRTERQKNEGYVKGLIKAFNNYDCVENFVFRHKYFREKFRLGGIYGGGFVRVVGHCDFSCNIFLLQKNRLPRHFFVGGIFVRQTCEKCNRNTVFCAVNGLHRVVVKTLCRRDNNYCIPQFARALRYGIYRCNYACNRIQRH